MAAHATGKVRLLAALVGAFLIGLLIGSARGETGAGLVGFALGYPLLPGLLGLLLLGWSERTRRHVPAFVLVAAGVLACGSWYAETYVRSGMGSAVESRTVTPVIGVRLGNTLAINDRMTNTSGKAAEFTIEGRRAYVSSEHASLDDLYRIASLYPAAAEGTGPSFTVVYTRADGAPLDRSDINRLLDNEGSSWVSTDSLTWWLTIGQDTSATHMAQCSTDRNTCTFSVVDQAGRFMSLAKQFDAAK